MVEAVTQSPAEGAATAERLREVLVALRRIIRATDLQSKRLRRRFGLTLPQMVVLQAIREEGEVSTRHLAATVALSQATVTTILDRLEARDLVERYRSLTDRRIVHTRLTATGRQTAAKAPPLLHERFGASFAALDPAHQGRIVQTLREVASMMGAAHLDAAPLLAVESARPSASERTGSTGL